MSPLGGKEDTKPIHISHCPRALSPGSAFTCHLLPTLLPLLLLLILLSPLKTGAADPCAALYSALQVGPTVDSISFAQPAAVLPCTQSVQFDPSRDLSNLDSISKYLKHFYSPLHIAKRAPDRRLESTYDVLAKLKGVRRGKWSTAEDFYDALWGALNGLNDGHTGILTNCPPFTHMLAFPLVAVVEGGVPVVRVAPLSLHSDLVSAAAAQSPFSFNAASYAGAKVVTINGKPAWKKLLWYAWAKGGNYHDIGQRLNSLLASPSNGLGYFAYRRVNPRSNFLPITLIKQGSSEEVYVRVPWLSATSASNLPGFTSTQDYYSGFCAPSSDSSNNRLGSNFKASWQLLRAPQGAALDAGTSPSSTLSAVQSGRKLMRRVLRTPKHLRALRNVRGALNRGTAGHATQLSADGDLFPVYLLNDGKTGVVQLNTFDYDSTASDPLLPYLQAATTAFNLANKHASRVIIDLSGNPGGYTELGPWIASLLLGSDRYPHPRSSMQADVKRFLADTPFSREMLSTGSYWYNWRDYADLQENPFTYSNRNLFFNPVTAQKYGSNGEEGLYSSFFKEQMQSLEEYLGRRVSPILGKKKFMLLSDGQCFSTCGTFANTMARRFGVPTVTIGGIPGRQMAFSGGGGGFVLGDVESEMLTTIPESLWSRSGSPRNFTMRMSMSMRLVNGFYNEEALAPIEFVFLPGQYSINFTWANVADPSLLYLEVAKLFT